MFGESVIQVVLGIVFVFSLTAILVTQINNIIIAALNLRSKQLKAGIMELVTDKQIRAKLLAHPIVNLVKTTVPHGAHLSDEDAENIAELSETKVTYIPASTFAEAITGILVAESNETLFEPLRRAINDLPTSLEKSQLRELLRGMRLSFSEDSLRRVYKLIDDITNAPHREGLFNAMQLVEEELEKLRFNHSELVPLLDGISRIKDEHLRSALETVMTSAPNISEAQKKIEAWFDDSMGRVGEIYARHMQRISFVVALVLVLVLNIDTIFIGRTLWEDPELRVAVADAATDFDTRRQPPKIAETTYNLDEMSAEELQVAVEEGQETVQNLLDLQIPLGWQFKPVTDEFSARSLQLGFPDPRNNPRNVWSYFPGNNDRWMGLWLQKLIGLALTVIAASQGAPFWFDLLNRIAGRNSSS